VLIVGISCVVLLLLTSVVHYEALYLLTTRLETIVLRGRSRLVLMMLGTSFAHAVEVLLYAAAYWGLAHFLGEGGLGSADGASLAACLYFSAETYTSLGYGDIVPTGALRLLAGMEALNGLLLIGCSRTPDATPQLSEALLAEAIRLGDELLDRHPPFARYVAQQVVRHEVREHLAGVDGQRDVAQSNGPVEGSRQ